MHRSARVVSFVLLTDETRNRRIVRARLDPLVYHVSVRR